MNIAVTIICFLLVAGISLFAGYRLAVSMMSTAIRSHPQRWLAAILFYVQTGAFTFDVPKKYIEEMMEVVEALTEKRKAETLL